MYYPWGKLETTLSLSHNESSHGLLIFFSFLSSCILSKYVTPCHSNVYYEFSWDFRTGFNLDKRGFIIVASRPSSPADRDPARKGSQSGRKKRREERFQVRAEELRAWKWFAFVCFLKWSHMISLSEICHLNYRGSRLFPLPIVPRALSIFSIIAVFIGIPSGSFCGGESLSSA